ncbi:MAG: aldehyde dehydrogenase family protein [Pseudomonadota bacterium]
MTERLKIRNPRTGEFDYEIPVAGGAEIKPLVVGLREAQRDWYTLGVNGRIEVLKRFQAALLAAEESVVAALSADTGRMTLAKGELMGLAGSIDRWCGLAPGLLAESEKASVAMPHVRLQEQLDPYPVLGVISPWNFPLLLSFIDAVPALLAGCSVVIKPSEVTPRFAAPVSEAIQSVPELHRVLRFISGDGRSGAALISEVDAVAFTGSVATGRKVAAACAEAFIPAFLELGGKDPVIVLEGSDLERASTAILRASVAATGQACQSLERIYVHANDHDEFVDKLTAKAAATPLSYPDPGKGIVGPLIFAKQAEIIAAHLRDAADKGAEVRTGGRVEQKDGGYWIAPTVLTNVGHDMQIMTEETFGPVMPVMPFNDEAEALALANDSIFGLSGAVFGPSEEDALRVARQLNAGGVSVNDAGMTTMIFEAPKNAYGHSGLGASRMGPTGLSRFLRQKALYVNRGATVPIEVMAEGSC